MAIQSSSFHSIRVYFDSFQGWKVLYPIDTDYSGKILGVTMQNYVDLDWINSGLYYQILTILTGHQDN
jgi:hypothetical protein